jgi:hypothetical protein
MTKFISNKQEHQTKQKQEGNKSYIIKFKQELHINECFISKTFKQPTRIVPYSILDRFVQWSCHLKRKQTKTTNPS